MGLPAFFGRNGHKREQEMKQRLLKNREAVLDVMAENIKGARSCPLLMGQKCIGVMCEHYMEFKSVDTQTGAEVPFYRCAHVQTPLLIIELNQSIARLAEALQKDPDA